MANGLSTPLATGMSLRPAISNSFKALVVATEVVGVAEDRRQPDDIELGGFEGVEDCHGIVDAGIGVDQDLREGSIHRESRTWRTPATRLVIF